MIVTYHITSWSINFVKISISYSLYKHLGTKDEIFFIMVHIFNIFNDIALKQDALLLQINPISFIQTLANKLQSVESLDIERSVCGHWYDLCVRRVGLICVMPNAKDR